MVGIYRNNINKVFFEGMASSLLNGYKRWANAAKYIGLYGSQNISPVGERFKFFGTFVSSGLRRRLPKQNAASQTHDLAVTTLCKSVCFSYLRGVENGKTTFTTPQSAKRSDMPMRYTRAWRATTPTADTKSTITSRKMPCGPWHWTQELPLLSQPRSGTPYGCHILAAEDLPTVGYRARKVAYRYILTHSGLLHKTSRRTPAAQVDTTGAESPFLRFNIPKGSEKIGGGSWPETIYPDSTRP